MGKIKKSRAESSKYSGRLDWIDALRAFAIVLVVLGHCMPDNIIFHLLANPVKMPVFFIISGFVFKDKERSFVDIVNYLLRRLIIPWLFLSLVWVYAIKYIIQGEPVLIFDELYDMLSGKSQWFMNCFIIAMSMLFIIYKCIKPDIIKYVLLFTLGIIGLILKHYGIANFSQFNNALAVQLFILLGILLKEYKNKIFKLPLWTIFVSILMYIVLAAISYIFYYPDCFIDVHTGKYYNLAISFSMIILGTYFLVSITEKISYKIRIPLFWIEVGRNTLSIYLLHGFFLFGFKQVFACFNLPFEGYTVLFGLLSVVIATVIGKVLNIYLPILVGATR